MISFVFKPVRDGVPVKFYSGKIRLDGWPRVRVFSLKTTDKRIADEKLRKLVLDFEKEALGILPPRAEREASRKPLSELVDAFLADLKGQGRARNTCRRYKRVLGAVLRLSGWLRLADITPASFAAFRASCGRSSKWVNDALGVLSTWLNWLVRAESMPRNPLEGATRARVTKAEHRRALSPDELQRLAAVSPPRRASVYLFFAYTGLRRAEANRLKWEHFRNLDGEGPVMELPADLTKNRKVAAIPLHPEAVRALLLLRPDLCQPFEWVFLGKVPTPAKLRDDLTAAGIPFQDERGRRLDVHALRKTFVTLLGAAGVSPQAHKTLARHSDMRLTMDVYTDAERLPLVAAIAALPSVTPAGRAQNRAHGPVISTRFSVHSVASCHFLADFIESVSVSLTPTTGAFFTYCLDHKMVGVERFELSASTSRT